MENIDLPLWEQQHKETNVAYAAFLTYRDMGSERTLREVAAKLLKSETIINRWSMHWHWANRIASWVRHNDRATEAAIQKQREAKAKEWAKREEDIRERQWQVAEKFLARAEELLKFPTVQQSKTTRQESEDGKTVTINTVIVNPVRADAVSDVAMWFKLHSAALGLEERTGGVGVAGAGNVAPVPTELQSAVVIMLPDNGRQKQGANGQPERNVTPGHGLNGAEAALPAPEAGLNGQNGGNTGGEGI